MTKKTVSLPEIAHSKSGDVTWTLGRERFANISAVEGIALTAEMEARSAEMDRIGASAEQRRAAIKKAHRR
jgi:hypothetical protein